MSPYSQRILVIDDELGPRESLRILLKNEYEVICADTVMKGLQFLKDRTPDAIVMDIRMPGMNGIEGLREIRHIDPNVAVIMLTGFGALETAQEAIRLGANDYLKKPFDTKEMMDAIRRNVQRSEYNRRRARTERELQDLNKRLVAELASKDRMASLGQASAELVHDLRNPLTVILGYVQILSEDLEKKTSGADQEAYDYIDVISSSVRRCRDLIDAWLNLARSGPSSYKPVAIAPLLAEVAKGSESIAAGRAAHLDVVAPAGDVMVMGDHIQLTRVFQNLLGNAIDALPPEGGVVRLECSVEEKHCAISVRDNGCGIDPAKLARVFEPYFTTKPSNQGTGLGLFITRKIVEEHGGAVSIESRPGEGTAVTVRMPRYEGDRNGSS